MRFGGVLCQAVLAALPCFSAVAADAPNWTRVLAKVAPASVLIRVESPVWPKPNYGSGFIFSKTGKILTARHLLPDNASIQSGNLLISALVYWTKPSVDFSQAIKLDIDSLSAETDVAVLKFRQAPASLTAVCADTQVEMEMPILVIGYPDGNNLTATPGVTSRLAEDDKLAIDAKVGIGNSGGPVVTAAGKLAGMLVEGPTGENTTRIALAFILSTTRIAQRNRRRRPS